MAEKFLGTLLLMFIYSCYFIYIAPSDTVAEIALEHVLVQRFKKKEMDKKITF